MKSEHLRVGNILFDFEGNATPIGAIDILAVSQCNIANTPVEFLKGIPLTEKWLFKFGFNRNDNKQYSDSFYHIKLSASELQINPDNGVVWIYNPIGHSFNNPLLIEYVHQLQNLYFALTGEELTPNKTDKK